MPSSKRMGTLAYSAVMFVVVSVLMGLLAAGLVVPFAAMAGTGSRSAAASLELLPEELETPPQPERSRVLAGDGSVLAYFFEENRTYVSLDEIAPVMRRAQVAIEDHRFYEHGAIDVMGTTRAFLQNAAGGATQGGSSITQQYVKMVQIEKAKAAGDQAGILAAQEQTYSRKLQEMRYAIALERQLSKDEILERYLNIAYFGDGTYGVEQASQHFFNKAAADLDVAEAAMLAGLVQNPTATDPARNPGAAVERRAVVLDRMADPEVGIITAEQAAEAKEVEWDPDVIRRAPNGCVGTEFPFLCDYVRRTLLQSDALGETTAEREAALLRGGLTIETEIDKDSQRAAEEAIAGLIDPEDPVISTMSMIEPGTGLIIAMAQSRPEMGTDDGQTFYNYAVEESMGGAEGFQVGSTFKPFTAAAALEQGIPLAQRYDSPEQMTFTGTEFDTCQGEIEQIQDYTARNSTRSGSNMAMDYAMDWSVNTYFLQLGRDTGHCNIAEMLDKTGVQRSNGLPMTQESGQDLPPAPSTTFSLPLGPLEVTPLSMSEAYATLAADGVHCDPVIIKSVTSSEGNEIEVPSANCDRVMDADVARGVTSLLEGVMDATGVPARLENGHDVAGKTGTTNDTEAVWFCGYSPEVAGCASVAADRRSDFWPGSDSSDRRLEGVRLPASGNVLQGSGGGDAGASIWRPAMLAAMEGREQGRFRAPSADIREGEDDVAPSVAGMSPDQAEQTLRDAGFTVVRANAGSSTPAGTYLGTSSTAGSQPGSIVYLYFSAGPGQQPMVPGSGPSGGEGGQ